MASEVHCQSALPRVSVWAVTQATKHAQPLQTFRLCLNSSFSGLMQLILGCRIPERLLQPGNRQKPELHEPKEDVADLETQQNPCPTCMGSTRLRTLRRACHTSTLRWTPRRRPRHMSLVRLRRVSAASRSPAAARTASGTGGSAKRTAQCPKNLPSAKSARNVWWPPQPHLGT